MHGGQEEQGHGYCRSTHGVIRYEITDLLSVLKIRRVVGHTQAKPTELMRMEGLQGTATIHSVPARCLIVNVLDDTTNWSLCVCVGAWKNNME